MGYALLNVCCITLRFPAKKKKITKLYKGICETTFKKRFANHKKSLMSKIWKYGKKANFRNFKNSIISDLTKVINEKTKTELKYFKTESSKHLSESLTWCKKQTNVLKEECKSKDTIINSRKIPVLPQASSKQADDQSRPQVSREMLPIHCHARTCLFNATLECTSPAKRFPPKTVNEKKFLSTKSLTFILTKNQSDYRMVL